MTSLLNLPKISYILFEIISYEIHDKPYEAGSSFKNPKSIDIVLMDVLPTRIQYKYASKKSYVVGRGDDNTSLNKGGIAPTKISFSGTFGQRWIPRGIKLQDGFGRLKEFKNLYLKTQGVSTNGKDDALYTLNYYDFTNHYWGHVDLDTFDIDEDAQRNSQIPSYSVTMTAMGKLISAKTSDPILRNLQYYITVQEKFDEWNKEVDSFLQNNAIMAGLNEIIVDIAAFEEALNIANGMVSNYTTAVMSSPVVQSLYGVGQYISDLPAGYDNALKNDFLNLLF